MRSKDFKYNYIINDCVSTIFIKNKQGKIFDVIVDTKNLKRVLNFKYKWYAHYHEHTGEYYIKATIYKGVGKNPETLFLHRFILKNKILSKDDVDHKDGNKLDNRELNLRITNNTGNLRNRKDKNKNNVSGYRNVCQVGNKLYVQLQINDKNTLLRTFNLDELEEAGRFAEEMRMKYYGEYAGSE